MRIKQENGFAEHLEHRASTIGAQATDPVIETDNDVSARSHQVGDREKGRPGVVGMVEHPVRYDDIHAGGPNARTEKIHLKELDATYCVVTSEGLPETKGCSGHVRRIASHGSEPSLRSHSSMSDAAERSRGRSPSIRYSPINFWIG